MRAMDGTRPRAGTYQAIENPWNLSPAELAACEAFAQAGCYKLAASATGLSQRTLEQHTGVAHEKIGARVKMASMFVYDRWAQMNLRTRAAPAAPAGEDGPR